MDKKTRFLEACSGNPVDRTPIWLMRQAGRYMDDYQQIRKKVSFLDLCLDPNLAARITKIPIDNLGVDAAIIFSDLLIPLLGLGFSLEYKEKIGPVITPSYKNIVNEGKFESPDPEEHFSFLRQSIQVFNQLTNGKIPLIGFTGAPFTLLSYIIEGGTSRSFSKTKKLLFQQPEMFTNLMEKITQLAFDYSVFQVESGIDALQIFDSWAGCLSPVDYREFVLPWVKKLFKELKAYKLPTIYFLKGSSGFLRDIKDLDASLISIDAFQQLKAARDILGPKKGVQGNLDPMSLYLPEEKLRERTLSILEETRGMPGHIFNLGHGILPDTNEAKVRFLVETVQHESIHFQT